MSRYPRGSSAETEPALDRRERSDQYRNHPFRRIAAQIGVVDSSGLEFFAGYRFNLGTNLVMMRYALPDVFVLMIVGTIPDYVQGGIKLTWALRGKHASA